MHTQCRHSGLSTHVLFTPIASTCSSRRRRTASAPPGSCGCNHGEGYCAESAADCRRYLAPHHRARVVGSAWRRTVSERRVDLGAVETEVGVGSGGGSCHLSEAREEQLPPARNKTRENRRELYLERVEIDKLREIGEIREVIDVRADPRTLWRRRALHSRALHSRRSPCSCSSTSPPLAAAARNAASSRLKKTKKEN